jgi:agmatine deiminase
MKPQYLPLIFSLIFIIGCKTRESNQPKNFSFPPEWEPHQAVWIDFTAQEYGIGKDHEAKIDIINALHKHVPVKVLVELDSMRQMCNQMMVETNIDTSIVEIIYHPIPNIFLRDAGPIFLSNGETLMIADFAWNCYGHAPFCEEIDYARGDISNDLAKQMGLEIRSTDIVAEGGGLEVSNTVILAFRKFGIHRNPGKSMNEIETVYLKMYNKEKIIWIEEAPLLDKNGFKIDNYFGQGGNAHIDAFMRFVNDSTILVSVIEESEKNNSPIQYVDYECLKANLNQIKKELNTDGKPFKIVEIPFPDVSLYEYKTLAEEWHAEQSDNIQIGDSIIYVPNVGYANFLISNGLVLVSEYWREGLPQYEKKKDEYVKEVLSKYFPNRKIIGINVLSSNWLGGGIHCQTQQEPLIKPR